MCRFIAAGVIAIGAAMLLSVVVSAVLAVPPPPSLARPIVDTTGTLTNEQITELAHRITTSRTEKSYQLAIYMLPSLDGEDIESYSIRVSRAWGVGERGANNGVLLMIAKDDHQLRIEVGSGLEGNVTDLEAGRIIDNALTPRLKEGKFYEAILAGVESIQAEVEGRVDPNASPPLSTGAMVEGVLLALFFGITLLSWLGSIFGRSKSWWAGGLVGGGLGGIVAYIAGFAIWSIISVGVLAGLGLLFDFLVSRNYKQHRQAGDSPSWWAGGSGWGGGTSGSSGSSFGGGGFSGGGASGSW